MFRGSTTACLLLVPLSRTRYYSTVKMSLRTPSEINSFWFGSDRSKFNDPAHIKFTMGKWFARTVPEVETTFIAESEQIVKLVDAGTLGDEWFTPEGYLARIVMFDQGSRTAFRGTPKAFAYDTLATALSMEIIDKNWFFTHYAPIERQAILTPLLHAEDIHAHNVAQTLAERISEGAEPEVVTIFAGVPHFFADHRKVVEQFGRFPSRNGALGRTNTPEEEAWLASPDLPAWARSQQLSTK